MKPINHISDIDSKLKRFAVYLGSQGIKYKIIVYDPGFTSESGEIHPVNSPFRFSFDSRGLIRRAKYGESNPMIFHHMPLWGEIFND